MHSDRNCAMLPHHERWTFDQIETLSRKMKYTNDQRKWIVQELAALKPVTMGRRNFIREIYNLCYVLGSGKKKNRTPV